MSMYLTLMGCVVFTITIILFVKQIIKIVKVFAEEESFGCKFGSICALLAIAVVGSGLGVLFQQVAHLIN